MIKGSCSLLLSIITVSSVIEISVYGRKKEYLKVFHFSIVANLLFFHRSIYFCVRATNKIIIIWIGFYLVVIGKLLSKYLQF